MILKVTLVATFFLIASCSNNQNMKDTKAVAEEQNEAKFDDKKQSKDAQFLVDAAEMNLKQIQLGRLAQQKGETADVKKLGEIMEDAHTKSQKEITALAKTKRISIPSSPTNDSKDAHNYLEKKSGNAFDIAYADMMVRVQIDAMNTFEKASNDSNDPEIKIWASTSLPQMRSHLDRSIACQKTLADMYFEENK